jgi:UDP-N-acetylglucosamine diphosphorylase/glucosamine-1-phosphate N-acetyltransferase
MRRLLPAARCLLPAAYLPFPYTRPMTAAIPAILFDDAPPGSTEWANLAPLTDLRPAFDIRTGARTTRERLASDARLALIDDASRAMTPVLAVSARCPLLPDAAFSLAPGQALVEARTNAVIAARLEPAQAPRFDPANHSLGVVPHDSPALLHRPWDVIRFRDACIAHDLRRILHDAPHDPSRSFTVDDDPSLLRIHPRAHIAPNVVFDTRSGPIVVGESEIQASSVIVGPVVIHDHSVVAARSFIKSNTVLGPTCKVGGEVGGTIFQGLANKVHDGHLGDSYVGEWANLGAGTTNSNLLNTYDEVITRISPRHPNERTGIRYLGAIIGDHAKFAINTRIMTGAVVGTGSMIAASQGVMKSTGRFRWITDERDTLYRFDKFLDVARAVMARRHITPTPDYIAQLKSLHDAERAHEK